MSENKIQNRLTSDDMWKLVALKYEYSDQGISDEYWDANFTKDAIRKDVAWLISKIEDLSNTTPGLPSFCANCTCGKASGCR